MELSFGVTFEGKDATDRAAVMLSKVGFEVHRVDDQTLTGSLFVLDGAELAKAEAKVRAVATSLDGEYLGYGGLSSRKAE